ncbi:MAG: hypothetical protein DLM72_09985 [Candidatus Nitrosopolaris wilkensis]|nr:MAG: hypothetical protein DLM72_09985 [Candidatus Nitrosopolaris wilkensis]
MNEIKIQYKNNFYDAQWSKEYSSMEKDIAVLTVRACGAEPFKSSKQSLSQLKIWGFGYHEEFSKGT